MASNNDNYDDGFDDSEDDGSDDYFTCRSPASLHNETNNVLKMLELKTTSSQGHQCNASIWLDTEPWESISCPHHEWPIIRHIYF